MHKMRCANYDRVDGYCPTCLAGYPPVAYDPSEQDEIIKIFVHMLRSATKDGGNKRARGEKPPWFHDVSHIRAIYSHLGKYTDLQLTDEDSGAHPLIHVAWRALAVAYQETYGFRPPAESGVYDEMEEQPADEQSSRAS